MTGAVVSETRRERQKAMKKCVKIWAAALVAALVIGFAACTGCVGGGDPARRAAVKAEIAEVMRLAYDVGGREIVSNRIERLVTENAPKRSGGKVAEGDGEAARKGPRKVTDEQAAYLHAAARCAEEALLRRVAEGEARAEGAQAAAAVYERTVERLAPTNAPAAKAD